MLATCSGERCVQQHAIPTEWRYSLYNMRSHEVNSRGKLAETSFGWDRMAPLHWAVFIEEFDTSVHSFRNTIYKIYTRRIFVQRVAIVHRFCKAQRHLAVMIRGAVSSAHPLQYACHRAANANQRAQLGTASSWRTRRRGQPLLPNRSQQCASKKEVEILRPARTRPGPTQRCFSTWTRPRYPLTSTTGNFSFRRARGIAKTLVSGTMEPVELLIVSDPKSLRRSTILLLVCTGFSGFTLSYTLPLGVVDFIFSHHSSNISRVRHCYRRDTIWSSTLLF